MVNGEQNKLDDVSENAGNERLSDETQSRLSTRITLTSQSGNTGVALRDAAQSATVAEANNKNTVASEPAGAPSPRVVKDKEVARLILPNGTEIPLTILKTTMGNDITLDGRQLYSNYKVMMFDPGFNSTSSCASSITYIDGDNGICLYRGYPVHELTARNDYLDVCYLLLYGQLPTTTAKKLFERQVKNEMLLHNRLQEFITSFVPGAHPMSILASVVSAFASFYSDPMSADHIDSYEMRELACVRLIAKLPTVVAGAYKTLIGEPLVYPRADLTYAENFLHMMFSKPIEQYHVDPLHAKIIDTFLIIHADHEQNASTSTVRSAGSSLANPYTCIASGITSLWGRAHGGANEAVIKMLDGIEKSEHIPEFLAKVKRKEVRLMGFGHRIYRNYDPRAKLMQDLCYKLRDVTSNETSTNLFDLALSLEAAALQDEYFTSRKLYPNVDFYSGVVMRALNVPVEMFTAMFALGRCVGWLSHWKEMVQQGQLKIARPRQLYVGEKLRHLAERNLLHEGKSESSNEWEAFYKELGPESHFHRVQAALAQRTPSRLIEDQQPGG